MLVSLSVAHSFPLACSLSLACSLPLAHLVALSAPSLLWAHAAVMAIQIAEKLLVGRGFDEVVRRRILPAYDRSLFLRHHVMWRGRAP